ncbi:MAG: Clp protease, partial [Hyphomicrobium sp.]
APPEPPVPVQAPPSSPASLPRTNYPDLGLTPPRQAAPPPHEYAEPAFEREQPSSAGRPAYRPDPSDPYSDFGDERPGAPPDALSQSRRPPPPDATGSPGAYAPDRARLDAPPPARTTTAARRPASSGPFVGSWPLIEAGQLVENIPRRMRVGVPVVVEARIARADVKALAEGLQGGGAAFRHEVVVTKAMSVRLRAPDGGFAIENRSPETQWIESVLGLANDDYASWRWTVTPRSRGRRQLQLIVSARTVGADGMTAETALPDQMIEIKVGINYARTFGRWMGWAAAAVVGGMLARFGEDGLVILRLLAAKYLGI